MNDQQLLRYSRHILLDEIGIPGQQKFNASHAIVIGAGGLGSPAAFYLASAGVGKITLIDDDVVELTNLQRQILHSTERIGQAKAQSGRQTLLQMNPEIEVVALTERARAQDLARLLPQADVVLDCTDNFTTRQIVNRACVAHGVPLVSGAAIRFDGQVSVFDSRAPHAPCYACVFPENAAPEEVQCATMGVFAPLTGIIGAVQAAEALKILAGIGTSLAGRLLMLDARSLEWHSVKIKKNPACAVCGTQANSPS